MGFTRKFLCFSFWSLIELLVSCDTVVSFILTVTYWDQSVFYLSSLEQAVVEECYNATIEPTF